MHVVIKKMISLKQAVICYIDGDRGGVERLVERLLKYFPLIVLFVWFLVFGFWLLALAFGFWLLAFGFWSFKDSRHLPEFRKFETSKSGLVLYDDFLVSSFSHYHIEK
jgi:hypothetical protein